MCGVVSEKEGDTDMAETAHGKWFYFGFLKQNVVRLWVQVLVLW